MFLGSSLALGPVGSSPESRVIKDLFNRAGVAIAGRDGTLVQSGATGSTALHPTTAAVATAGSLIGHNLTIPGVGTLPMSFAQGSRTNLILQSQSFTAPWGGSLFSVAASPVTAPDGSSAVRLTLSGAAGYFGQGATVTAGVTNTRSVYIRRVDTDWVLVIAYYNGSNLARVWFNTATGQFGSEVVVGSVSVVAKAAHAIGSGWYRLCITAQHASLTSTTFNVFPVVGDGSTSAAVASLDIWGAQLEQASFPGLYIPTTSASLTRAADNILWTPPSALSTTSGEVVAVAAPYLWSAAANGANPAGGDIRLFRGNDGTTLLRASSSEQSIKQDAGTQNATASSRAETSGVLRLSAQHWDASAVRLYQGATLAASDSTLSAPWGSVASLSVGMRGDTVLEHWHGFIGLLYVPSGLTDAERSALARLTIGTLNYVG